MTYVLSLLAPVQEFVIYDSTGQAMARGEAVGPLISFSNMGIMRWPITFCLVMVAVLAVRAAMRIRAGQPDQKAAARATIDGSLFWGAYAVALGVLGTVAGFMQAAQAVESVGQVDTRLVWGGVKVALSTTVYGLVIFTVAALVWFGLRQWHRRAVLSTA